MKFLWLEFATKNVPANYMRSQVKKNILWSLIVFTGTPTIQSTNAIVKKDATLYM
jgi:hypothetical protein